MMGHYTDLRSVHSAMAGSASSCVPRIEMVTCWRAGLTSTCAMGAQQTNAAGRRGFGPSAGRSSPASAVFRVQSQEPAEAEPRNETRQPPEPSLRPVVNGCTSENAV